MATNSNRGGGTMTNASISSISKSPVRAPMPQAIKKTSPKIPAKSAYPTAKPVVTPSSPITRAAPPQPVSKNPAAVVMDPVFEDDDCVTEHSMEPVSHSHEGRDHEPLITDEKVITAAKKTNPYIKMSRSDIRRAFVMSEILGKPKSRR